MLYIRLFSSESTLSSDTLYLVPEELFPTLTARRGPETVHAVVFSDDAGLLKRAGIRKTDNAVVVRTSTPIPSLLEGLQLRLADILRIDAAFSEGILSSRSPDELFPLGEQFVRLDYAIVDLNMNVVFCTPGYASSRGVKDGKMPSEVFQELISHGKFHEAATQTERFYYYNSVTNTTHIGRNIILNGLYIACLIVLLPGAEQELPTGGEQLIEALAAHVQNVYSHVNLPAARDAADMMHGLCRAVISGEPVDMATGSQILASFNWVMDHRYICTVLRFSAAVGWDAQLRTVLPYIATSLERLFPNACAITTGDEVYMVQDADAENAGSMSEYLHKLAVFIRENLCKAGISPFFNRFDLLHDAAKAAVTALEYGSVQRPDLWYYRFDDYRLFYCLDSLVRELPSEMICHPALNILDEYDRAHGTALTETLRTYLACNLNMTEASERLFIHRTSFCRRMTQIRKLTGLDFTDEDTILMLQLSCRIFQGTSA